MTSRRICLVTTELRGLTAGGIGAAVVEVGASLARQGWDVTFLVAGPGADLLARGEGDPSEAMAAGRVIGTEDPSVALVERPVPDWAFGNDLAAISDRAARVLEHLAAAAPFDVVEFPDYQGLGWAALRRRDLCGGPLDGTAVVVRLHGTLEICMEHELVPMRSHRQRTIFALERGALAAADRIVAPTAELAAWYGERYGIDTSDVVVSRLPFTPLPALERARPAGGPVHVVSVGKVQRLKGAHLFVDAAIALLGDDPDGWRFTLVGGDTVDARTGGSLTASLRARIPDAHASRVAFPGQVDRDSLAAVVADADVLVYPNRVETYCLAAYEALPSGRPAVLSAIPAFDVVAGVRDRAGLATVRFDDPSDLPHAIRRAAQARSDATSAVDVGELSAGDVSAYGGIVAPPGPAVEGDPPLVSVVVPYYEMQDHVEATVASVLASSYRELEVIVVDDGTPSEAARRKLDELAPAWAADGRVRVVHRSNGGLGAARNTGIAEARGELVLPVDSDDLVDERMVEVLATALRRAPHLDAVSCYTKFFEDESTREPVDWVIPYDLDPVLLALENRAGVASSMFRRSLFDEVRYDERLWSFEDW